MARAASTKPDKVAARAATEPAPASKSSGPPVPWLTGWLAVGSAIIGFTLGSFNLYDRVAAVFFPAPPKLAQDYFVLGAGMIEDENWKDGFLTKFSEQFSGYQFRLPRWVTDEFAQRDAILGRICDQFSGQVGDEGKAAFGEFCRGNLQIYPFIGTYAVRNVDKDTLTGLSLVIDDVTLEGDPLIDLLDRFHTYQLTPDRKCIDFPEMSECAYAVTSIKEDVVDLGALTPGNGVIVPIYIAWSAQFPMGTEVPEDAQFDIGGVYDTVGISPLRLPQAVMRGDRKVLASRPMNKSPTIELGEFEGRG